MTRVVLRKVSAHRFGRRAAAFCVVFTAVSWFGATPQRAAAYLFLQYPNADADQATGWDPEVWGPGATLLWHIEDSPHWRDTGVDSAADAIPYVQRALDVWSQVPTLDAEWRVAGVVDGTGQGALDGRNTVFLDPETDHPGERVWRRRIGDRFYTVECDIPNVPQGLVWAFREGIFGRLHGLGHCLSLAHAAVFPAWRSDSTEAGTYWPFTELWSGDPKMSYGPTANETNEDSELTADDRIGASLLRPQPGWRARTGSLAGRLVFEDGTPLPYGHVWAIQRDGTSLRASAGGFSNGEGQFLIEGLPPGDYVLWSHPILSISSLAPFFGEEGATGALDLDDAIWPHLVRVEAGAVTSGPEIRMRKGRRAAPFEPGRPSIRW